MRSPTPDTLLTDEELAQSGAEIDRIPNPIQATAEIDPNRVRPDPGIFNSLASGVKGVGPAWASIVYAGVGAVAETGLLGEKLDSQSGEIMNEAVRYQQLGAEMAPEINSMGEIDSFGDFTAYTAGMLGAFLPDIGVMKVAGLAGKTAAKSLTASILRKEVALQVSKGISREVAEESVTAAVKANLQNPEILKSLGRLGNLVAKERAASFAAATAVAGSYGVARESGNIVTDIYEKTGEVDGATALAWGIPAGLTDAMSDIFVGGKLFGIGSVGKEVAEKATAGVVKRGVMASAGRGVGKGIITEAPTEALQQAMSIAAVKSKTGEDWTSSDYDQLKEAAFGGGVLGGLLGGASGGVEGGLDGARSELDFKRHASLEKSKTQVKREKGTDANIKKAEATVETIDRLQQVDSQGSPTKATQAALAEAARFSIEEDEDALDAEAERDTADERKKILAAAEATATQQELPPQAAPATDEKIAETKPVAEKATEADLTEVQPSRATDMESAPKFPKELEKSGSNYSAFNREFTLNFESDLDRAAYYVANETKKSKSHDKFLAFGESHGYTPAELVAHGKTVKSNIKSMAQVSKPGALSLPVMGKPKNQKAPEVKAEVILPTIEASTKAAEQEIEVAAQEEVEKEAAPDIKPTSRADDRGTVEVPVDNIKLSEDVPQFKSGADPKTGVVAGDEIGEYQRFPKRAENPIMLWERLNGDIEVVSGRHRLHSAKTSGEKTIPSQIWKESEGYDAPQMAALDAASNIQDGNGKIQDYAQYIRNAYAGLTPEQAQTAADSAGLLGRAPGRAGFEIGINSSDALYSALLRGNIKGLTVNKAAIIAKSAPLDDDLQRAAMKMVAGLTEESIPGFIARLNREMTRGELQQDLFGENDTILVDAARVSKAAIAKQKKIQESINLVSNNVRKSEESAAMGVPVKDIEATRKKLATLEAEKARVANYTYDDEVVVELGGTPRRRVEITEAEAATPTIAENGEGNLFPESELPFNLFGEEDTTALRQKQVDERNAAAEAKLTADGAQLDMFSEPTTAEVDSESKPPKIKSTIEGYNAIQDPKKAQEFLRDEIAGISDPEMLKAVADTGFKDFRMFVARNPNTDPDTLVDLAKDRNNFTKVAVAQHPNTPVSQLEAWAASNDPGVRTYAAMSPNLTEDLREQLSKDESGSVRGIIESPQGKYLLSKAPVTIESTPTIGRGPEHASKIKSAVENISRMFPDRKTRFVESAEGLQVTGYYSKSPTNWATNLSVDDVISKLTAEEGGWADTAASDAKDALQDSTLGNDIKEVLVGALENDIDAIIELSKSPDSAISGPAKVYMTLNGSAVDRAKKDAARKSTPDYKDGKHFIFHGITLKSLGKVARNKGVMKFPSVGLHYDTDTIQTFSDDGGVVFLGDAGVLPESIYVTDAATGTVDTGIVDTDFNGVLSISTEGLADSDYTTRESLDSKGWMESKLEDSNVNIFKAAWAKSDKAEALLRKMGFAGTIVRTEADARKFKVELGEFGGIVMDEGPNAGNNLSPANSLTAKKGVTTMRLYHGSSNGDFDKFMPGTHFAEDWDYAKRYTDPSYTAIAWSGKKTVSNPTVYQADVTFRNLFDTRNKAGKDLFDKEFFGKEGNSTPLTDQGLPDWADSMDLADWLEANHPEFDGIVMDEGPNAGNNLSYMPLPGADIRVVGKSLEKPTLKSQNQGEVEAFYDPATGEMVFVTDSIKDEVRAAQLFVHEATEGNLSRIDATPEGKAELDSIFKRSQAAISKETPSLLKEAGYASVQELADAYGFDMKTPEGKRAVQWELTARFAERIASDPKPPVWWKRMLSDIKGWIKKHFNITMSATDLESFLRKELSRSVNVQGVTGAKILMSQKQQLQEVTVEDAKRMSVPDLAKASSLLQGMSNRDDRYNTMLDIIQDEILRRTIRADRNVGGVVTIDRDWAFRVATNPEGTINPDAFEVALTERLSDGNSVYIQEGASPANIVTVVDGQILLDEGDSIPISKFQLSSDKIFTRPAKEPAYLKPGERRGQQDPSNVPATNGSNVDEPVPDRWDKAQYFMHEKMKPIFGEKDGPNQRGGALGSGSISKETRDLINTKNQFIAAKVKVVEFRWNRFHDAIKAEFPDGGHEKLIATAQGIIANTIDADQRRRSEAIGRGQYDLAQARWVADKKPQLANAISRLDTRSKRNAFLGSELNAAEYNQMNSQSLTAQTEATKNAIGAFRLDNYNKAKAAKVAALEQLPEEVADALQSMNLAIDELMAYGIKNKLISSRLTAAVGDQPGLYMVRTYHLLDDPDFRAKVKAGQALTEETQRLSEWIHTSLINSEAKKILAAHVAQSAKDGKNPWMTAKDARVAASVSEETDKGKVLGYLNDLQDVKYEDQAYTVLDTLLEGSTKELGLPQEVMDAWGVHTDAGANFTKTIQRVAQDIATTQMMRDLVKLGTERGFLVDPKVGGKVPAGFVKMKPIGKYGAMKELDGLYAPERFQTFFEKYYDPAEVHPMFKLMAHSALATTLAKTVFSLPSLSVNFLSGPLFAVVAGHSLNAVTGGGMMSGVSNGWASLRGKSSKEAQAYVEKLIRLGVFGNNVGPQMAKEIMLQASRSIDDIDTDLSKSLLNPNNKWYKSPAGLVKKAVDFRGRLYGMADEIWKVNGFEAEIKEIEAHEAFLESKDGGNDDIEPEFKFKSAATLKGIAAALDTKAERDNTPESRKLADKAQADYDFAYGQIEQRAADYTRDAYPTYDLAPQFVKDVKAIPFLGQFMTFPAAMVRTVKRTGERAVQDIRSDDEFLQHRGYMTLGRMASVVAAPSALAIASVAMCGISDEEEEALRASLPAWQRNATLIFLGKDSEGKIRYWDTSRVDPYKMFKEPFFAAISKLDGDITNVSTAVGTGIVTAVKPWLGVDIATGSMLEAFYNNKGDGARVYNPEDPDAWLDITKHIAKGFEPGDLTMARNLTKGVTGESDMASEIASAFGFRSQVHDPVKSLGFSTWKATTRLRDANNILLKAINTGEDVDGAFADANEARAAILKPLWNQYHAAITRGVSEEEADATLKGGRLSKDQLLQIKGGYLLPYTPGAAAMRKAKEATAETIEDLIKSTERVYFEEQ
jgi:hypothetical protein